MSGVGLLFSGPWMHLMYSKVLPRLVPSTSSFLAFKKLAIDQTAGATFMVSGALLTANVLRGKDLAASVKDTQAKFMATLILNWKIWNVASAINFQYVPMRYQPLYCSVVGVFYYAGVSMIATSDDETEVVEETTAEKPGFATSFFTDIADSLIEMPLVESC